MVDTHCHLHMIIEKTEEHFLSENHIRQIKNIISDAHAHGVHTLINVGTSLVESEYCLTLARHFQNVYATLGIHPNDITPLWKKELAIFKKWIQKRDEKIVGIGECGIDLFHKRVSLADQKDVFKAQIELALEFDLTLIIHSRDAYDETLSTLEPYAQAIRKGIFHCFSYDMHFAKQAIEWGFLLGIGGTITYPRNETLRNVVKQNGLEYIVLETDAPFLPIQAMRGKKNHPQYIQSIARYIGSLVNVPWETVAAQTTENARIVFGIL